MCNTLQHTLTTPSNTLQHTAKHCKTLQHITTHYNTPQHTAAHCRTIYTYTSRFVFILLHIDHPRSPWTAGRQVSQLQPCTHQKNQDKQRAEGRFTCSIHMRHSGHTCKMKHTHMQSGIRLTHPHVCTYISPVFLRSFLSSA